MKKDRQLFDAKQQTVLVCESGRIMVCLNEEEVASVEQVPVSMGEDGTMEYEDREKAQYAYDVYWLDGYVGDNPLETAKASVLQCITAYDSSSAVNSFELNDASVWLDKATRVGLMNSTNIAKAMGNETTILWLGDVKLEVDCDKAIQLLSALEMYALECFNVTAAHKKEVSSLDSIEKVLAYDFTSGYPAKLKMEV